jgi:hypothetical protein
MHDVVSINPASVDAEVEQRAHVVRQRLNGISAALEENFFDLCELLMEAQTNAYHVIYGFGRFGEWVEEGSGLDMSARSAYYHISIAKKTAELGLTREDVRRVKISLLKKIFELEPKEHADEMRELVADAANMSLDEVIEEVNKLRKAVGKSAPLYKTFKFDVDLKQVIDEAFALARMSYGDVVDPATGEITEASDSRCMELICAEYLASGGTHNGAEEE